MRIFRKITIILLCLGILMVGFGIWYKTEYSMTIAEAFELNNQKLDKKMLIATQGSAFKDKVTQEIISYFKNDPIYIQVVDISRLKNFDANDYSGIVIMHTWENWQAPADVELFLEEHKAAMNKIVILTTSGSGTSKMEDVDAITGESSIEDSRKYSIQIIQRLQEVLNI